MGRARDRAIRATWEEEEEKEEDLDENNGPSRPRPSFAERIHKTIKMASVHLFLRCIREAGRVWIK